MSGLSVHASQIQKIIVDQGIPVLAEAYAAQPRLWSRFAEVIGVEEASTPYKGDISTTLLGLTQPDEIEHGQEIPAGTLEMGYTPQGKIRKFGRSIRFTREDILAAGSNVHNMVMKRVEDLFPQFATAFASREESIVAGMLNNGALTAGSVEYFRNSYDGRSATDGFIYDGLPWFDTAHPQSPTVTTTTYSNHTASLALSDTNLKTALIAFESTNAKDGRGQRIVNRPDALIVPPGLQYTALGLLESANVAGTANNDKNTLPRLEVIVHPYLSDSDAWYLCTKGQGLRVISGGVPRITVEEERSTDTVVVHATSYFGAYVRDWRPWYAANIAAS